MTTRKFIKPAIFIAIVFPLVVVYATFDPEVIPIFPACPFHSFTGLLCPGCGSQRALHHLLNLQVKTAFSYNPLLILALPYVLAGAVIDRLRNPSQKILKWRKVFFGRTAIFIILFVIIAFWITRNL